MRSLPLSKKLFMGKSASPHAWIQPGKVHSATSNALFRLIFLLTGHGDYYTGGVKRILYSSFALVATVTEYFFVDA
jgi:hypothetical protein